MRAMCMRTVDGIDVGAFIEPIDSPGIDERSGPQATRLRSSRSREPLLARA